MSTANFRVSTDILKRLGEELITSFDQGIIELVKNAYDADAHECTIELKNAELPGGTVFIEDDGDGMSLDEIRDGWLVLGRSQKVTANLTRLGRLRAGSKGLGRLGALRVGEEARLFTRPRDEEGSEYAVCICWHEFEKNDVIEDTLINIERSPTSMASGTRIEIKGLRNWISESEVHNLARALILLSDPFGDPSGFKPKLVAPEFKALEELVSRQYFDDCEFRLIAELDHEGRASARVFDRSGLVKWESGDYQKDALYSAPSATFEIWAFLLNSESFASRSATIGEVRKWLEVVGGIHLYHRGLRVRPYGDPANDWLDLNLARSRDPELRPSTNTSVGRMTILDANEELLQKTDRTGFMDLEAFREMRRFGIEALEWMHSKRLKEREVKKRERKLEVVERNTQAKKKLSRAILKLPQADRKPINAAVREMEAATLLEHNQFKEELTLYRTLASVGTAVSVFAHEIEGPASDLIVSVNAIERRSRKALAERYKSTMGMQVDSIKRSAELIARFATLPLGLLRRNKRRRTTIDVNKVLASTADLFKPYLADARVKTICHFSNEPALVHGSVAAFEAIISNLITNSVKAFKRQDAELGERILVFSTRIVKQRVHILAMDNGPGIQRSLGDSIWLPGVTSDENGTGMGLTIVRDTLADLNGSAQAVANGEYGGAEFIIMLPGKVQGR